MGFWDALCVGALSIVFQRVTAMAFAAFGVFCGAQDSCAQFAASLVSYQPLAGAIQAVACFGVLPL